jgi:hypothetical protein
MCYNKTSSENGALSGHVIQLSIGHVHIAGKLKLGAERKGKKRKKVYLNNWTPWN